MICSQLEAPVPLEPFGMHFRQVLPLQPQMKQTTSEPEITTGDGGDPDKIDSDWIPDEDEDEEDEDHGSQTHETDGEALIVR